MAATRPRRLPESHSCCLTLRAAYARGYRANPGPVRDRDAGRGLDVPGIAQRSPADAVACA